MLGRNSAADLRCLIRRRAMLQLRIQNGLQGVHSDGAVVPLAVDENRWGTLNTGTVAILDIPHDGLPNLC